jgi:hypothetical protein
MAIYELTKDIIREIEEARFAELGVSERGDLQRLLREQVEVFSPETLVIAEEFGDWEDGRRRIDLPGLDKEAKRCAYGHGQRVGRATRGRATRVVTAAPPQRPQGAR